MKNLIKFLGLVSVFGCELSLFPAATGPAIDSQELYAQTHFLNSTLLGSSVKFYNNKNQIAWRDGRIFIYSDAAESKLEGGELKNFTLDQLFRDGYVQRILVDSAAYQQMQEKLGFDYIICDGILSKFNLKKVARIVVDRTLNKSELKVFSTRILDIINPGFPENYGSAFFCALSMHSDCGMALLSDSTKIYGSENLNPLGNAAWELVKITTRACLHVCLETDNLNGLDVAFDIRRVQKEVFEERIKAEIDDSFIVASNIVAAKYLLKEILNQLSASEVNMHGFEVGGVYDETGRLVRPSMVKVGADGKNVHITAARHYSVNGEKIW